MQTLTMEANGIHGYFFEAANPFDTKKAIIVVGGSEGNENIPMKIGNLFAENGFSALGLCYWNMPGLSDNLVDIPVEIMEQAVNRLKDQGYERIGLYGLSKGAEYALLSASLIPDISCVIAVCPSFCIWAGLKGGSSMLKKGFSNTSSFTWHGKSLPYVSGKKDKFGIIKRLITQQQINMCFMYERSLMTMNPNAVIKVENINGPVLLQYPKEDSMWPSRYSAEQIFKRLQVNSFTHPAKSSQYTCSHLLVPMAPSLRRVFKIERTHPELCDNSRKDAFKEAVDWFSKW